MLRDRLRTNRRIQQRAGLPIGSPAFVRTWRSLNTQIALNLQAPTDRLLLNRPSREQHGCVLRQCVAHWQNHDEAALVKTDACRSTGHSGTGDSFPSIESVGALSTPLAANTPTIPTSAGSETPMRQARSFDRRGPRSVPSSVAGTAYPLRVPGPNSETAS